MYGATLSIIARAYNSIDRVAPKSYHRDRIATNWLTPKRPAARTSKHPRWAVRHYMNEANRTVVVVDNRPMAGRYMLRRIASKWRIVDRRTATRTPRPDKR